MGVVAARVCVGRERERGCWQRCPGTGRERGDGDEFGWWGCPEVVEWKRLST